MENLYLNVILKQKTNEGPEIFFKKDNTIESSKLKEPAKLGIRFFKKEKIFDKNESINDIFKSTQEFLKNAFQNGCMTILTFGQKNFIYSGEDSNGVLLKIAKEIFDYAEYNKDTKIELKVESF